MPFAKFCLDFVFIWIQHDDEDEDEEYSLWQFGLILRPYSWMRARNQYATEYFGIEKGNPLLDQFLLKKEEENALKVKKIKWAFFSFQSLKNL